MTARIWRVEMLVMVVVRVAGTGVSREVNALLSPVSLLKLSLLSGSFVSVVVPAVRTAGVGAQDRPGGGEHLIGLLLGEGQRQGPQARPGGPTIDLRHGGDGAAR